MVALKLKQFGGMIPATDVRLLPDNQADLSENAWLYSGALEGFRELQSVHTLSSPSAKRVFRIPTTQYTDKEHMTSSVWLEFSDRETDVIPSPVNADTFDRFYWTAAGGPPQYNTKARILAGNVGASAPLQIGIPTPAAGPRVSRVNSTYYFDCTTVQYHVVGGTAYMYDTKGYNVDKGTFFSGELQFPNYGDYGASKALVTSGGVTTNRDTSHQVISGAAVNAYLTDGNSIEMRYTNSTVGNRISISDDDRLVINIPPSLEGKPSYTGVGVLETRAYVYTWVSAYGEEGPPSPAMLNTGWSGDPWYIKTTAPTAADLLNRNLSKVRIYRTVTGVGGTTTYFLVDEMDISLTSYTDIKADDVVADNAILASYYYSAPPSFEGMTTMANGMVAGFLNKEVWFCEPYRMHAWPAPYTITFDVEIIGLGFTGQTLMVLTNSAPYAVTGINPAQMSVARLKRVEPCTSKGSIVSTATGVMYCSPNGLAMATAGDVTIVTNNLVTKDHWGELVSSSTMRACQLGGAYYGWGSIEVGCFEPTAFDNSSFQLDDFDGSYRGIFIDFSNDRVAFNTLLSSVENVNTFMDIWTGEIFIIRGGQVYWLNLAFDRQHAPYKWRSKIFEMPNRRNLEAMRVWFSTYSDSPALNPVPVVSPTVLASDMWGIVRVYADDRLVYSRELRTSGDLFRLPSGFKAAWWQIEIESRIKVNNIEIATSAKELISV